MSNTYRFQMERSQSESASIMGVPTSHIHFAPTQAQSFHKIYMACCSKTHRGGRLDTHSLSLYLLPQVRGCHGMSLCVTCRASRPWPCCWPPGTDHWSPHTRCLWPQHSSDHNWAWAGTVPSTRHSPAVHCGALRGHQRGILLTSKWGVLGAVLDS